jgi:hypothetical protein
MASPGYMSSFPLRRPSTVVCVRKGRWAKSCDRSRVALVCQVHPALSSSLQACSRQRASTGTLNLWHLPHWAWKELIESRRREDEARPITGGQSVSRSSLLPWRGNRPPHRLASSACSWRQPLGLRVHDDLRDIGRTSARVSVLANRNKPSQPCHGARHHPLTVALTPTFVLVHRRRGRIKHLGGRCARELAGASSGLGEAQGKD